MKKGTLALIVILALVAGGGFYYWFQARITCGERANRGSGSIETQIYQQSVGISSYNKDTYKGCMREFGF